MAHVDNKKKDIICGKDPTDRLDNSTIITVAEYSINFKVCIKMEATVYYMLVL